MHRLSLTPPLYSQDPYGDPAEPFDASREGLGLSTIIPSPGNLAEAVERINVFSGVFMVSKRGTSASTRRFHADTLHDIRLRGGL